MINLQIIIISTIIIELATILGRFVFKISSNEVYLKIIKKLNLKHSIHFHHAFFGAIISILAFYWNFNFFFNFGIGMILSDAIHHFVVLWIVVGNPEFHIIYKNPKYIEKERRTEKRKMKKFAKNIFK